MHFRPFHIEDYPHIRDDLAPIKMDMTIARLGRNAISSKGVITFFLTDLTGMRKKVVPLNEKDYEASGLTENEKMCLKRIVALLEEADIRDYASSRLVLPSQFEVKKTIRGFDQNFGGGRFVDLCLDLIETNMGECLYPYMVVDLAEAVFCSYNKNVNRDIEGFMEGMVVLIDELIKKDEELREICDIILERSSLNIYLQFISKALYSPSIAPVLRQSILGMFCNPSFDYSKLYGLGSMIPSNVLLTFPKSDLIYFFSNALPEYSEKVSELFFVLGESCDQEYLEAYRHNPNCDIDVLIRAPGYKGADEILSRQVEIREFFKSRPSSNDIIDYFRGSLSSDEEKGFFITECRKSRYYYLSFALEGECRYYNQLDGATVAHLMPYLDLEDKKTRETVVSYVRNSLSSSYSSHRELLLSLYHPCFLSVVRKCLEEKSDFVDMETRLIMAERYSLVPVLGLKEWR